MKKIKRIDLSKKKIYEARRAIKRLLQWRADKNANVGFYFLLPAFTTKRKNYFFPDKISANCPYCGSVLVETEAGVVCSGEKLPAIGRDILRVINKWGDKAELFLNKKENRFFDYYLLMGPDMTCDYIMGNEERKYRIKNRLLSRGVDRKKIFGGR